MWFRVFATGESAPGPAYLMAHLRAIGMPVHGDFSGDDLGWFRADLTLEGRDQPLRLDRYLTDEEEIRDQLNAWAAWLETVPNNPYIRRLMQHMIGTRQIFTIQCTREEAEDQPAGRFCVELCRHLARETKGVYQADSRGFFAAHGKLLVKE
jgi:hypothetical protein